MTTEKQKLGALGESLVAKKCSCPKCKKNNTLVRLPANFKCADIICDFCGYLAQVKTSKKKDISNLPKTILGAAWVVQEERMNSGIYFPLFIVLVNDNHEASIYYLSADLQSRSLFVPRKPLSPDAKRAGWQGFIYDLSKAMPGSIVKIV